MSREIAEQMHVGEGEFIVAPAQGGIALTPAPSIPPDEAWLWTREWQARVAEAEADRLAGRSTVYASEDEFLAVLDGE